MRYSICVTVYNSEDIVNDFLRPLIPTEYEIVVVDGMSTDRTPELLSKYGDRIKIIEQRCSRGLGRKIAIENSTGDIIIIVDFDIQISSLQEIVEAYEKIGLEDKISVFHLVGHSCSPNVFIGKKTLFNHYDAWQDVNYMDDVYFEKVCNHFDALRRVNFEANYKCLQIRGSGSGTETRYEVNIVRKILRRIKITADILFVSGFTYNQLLNFYKLKYIPGKLYGLALYIPAKLISYFIKTPSVNEKIKEIQWSGTLTVKE